MARKKNISQAFPRSLIRFQNEFLDFQKGIRVGHLDDHQRITRILKLALEARYQEEFVTERFGRGVYWQWIGFASRSNRALKPISSKISFGCSKFFLTIDTEDKLFKCGFSVERGMIIPPPEFPQIRLMPDWDWHQLLAILEQESPMRKELKRLVTREGFVIEAGNWDIRRKFDRKNFPDMAELKKALEEAPPAAWAGFQVYYPMDEKAVRSCAGADLIEAMMAVFNEVTPAMNLCMRFQLK